MLAILRTSIKVYLQGEGDNKIRHMELPFRINTRVGASLKHRRSSLDNSHDIALKKLKPLDRPSSEEAREWCLVDDDTQTLPLAQLDDIYAACAERKAIFAQHWGSGNLGQWPSDMSNSTEFEASAVTHCSMSNSDSPEESENEIEPSSMCSGLTTSTKLLHALIFNALHRLNDLLQRDCSSGKIHDQPRQPDSWADFDVQEKTADVYLSLSRFEDAFPLYKAVWKEMMKRGMAERREQGAMIACVRCAVTTSALRSVRKLLIRKLWILSLISKPSLHADELLTRMLLVDIYYREGARSEAIAQLEIAGAAFTHLNSGLRDTKTADVKQIDVLEGLYLNRCFNDFTKSFSDLDTKDLTLQLNAQDTMATFYMKNPTQFERYIEESKTAILLRRVESDRFIRGRLTWCINQLECCGSLPFDCSTKSRNAGEISRAEHTCIFGFLWKSWCEQGHSRFSCLTTKNAIGLSTAELLAVMTWTIMKYAINPPRPFFSQQLSRESEDLDLLNLALRGARTLARVPDSVIGTEFRDIFNSQAHLEFPNKSNFLGRPFQSKAGPLALEIVDFPSSHHLHPELDENFMIGGSSHDEYSVSRGSSVFGLGGFADVELDASLGRWRSFRVGPATPKLALSNNGSQGRQDFKVLRPTSAGGLHDPPLAPSIGSFERGYFQDIVPRARMSTPSSLNCSSDFKGSSGGGAWVSEAIKIDNKLSQDINSLSL